MSDGAWQAIAGVSALWLFVVLAVEAPAWFRIAVFGVILVGCAVDLTLTTRPPDPDAPEVQMTWAAASTLVDLRVRLGPSARTQDTGVQRRAIATYLRRRPSFFPEVLDHTHVRH